MFWMPYSVIKAYVDLELQVKQGFIALEQEQWVEEARDCENWQYLKSHRDLNYFEKYFFE